MIKPIPSKILPSGQSPFRAKCDYQTNAYPYNSERIVLGWKGRSQAFIGAALIAVLAATWNLTPLTISTVDNWVLRVIFPAVLAVVLALTPTSASRLSRIVKDLTVVSLIMAIFGGDFIPFMVASFPFVLAVSVAIDRSHLAKTIWEKRLDS
jgi:hypothetical protein